MNEIEVLSLTLIGVLVIILGIMRLRHVSVHGLIFGLTGAILGLLLGALASVPLSKLPNPFGGIMPVAVSAILTLILTIGMLSRRQALAAQLPFLRLEKNPNSTTEPAEVTSQLPPILVDTSVIIDGRIADIAAAGFVPGRLVVPRFVLAELQNIADSEDAMRRGRGRRGLDVLNQLREMPGLETEIIEDDVPGIREVDAKLVALGQKFKCNVLTTDYNLNRVAQIQGVRVLNVNELSNAIRPVVLPGEELVVRVVQPGKERNQGVGYLADGTMIVVENGDKLIGQDVSTEVTRVFQTVAGKMIFAVPRGSSTPAAPTQSPKTPADAQRDKPAPSSEAASAVHTAKDDNNRKARFNNRNRNRKPNNSASPGKGLEERVIAATNKPNHRPADQ